MKSTSRRCSWLTVGLLGSALVSATEYQDITVKHVVQPGENLHAITRSYLGTDILWQDNWRLNPHINNPNQLKVGDELTIIKERIIPAEKAKVLRVVNRVEKKPAEGDWLSAINGDELVQQEGVRTFEKSSALLEFNDESELKILEFSQVFLQSRSTDIRGTDSATIEVVKGDAELNWEPLNRPQTEITIVTGGTVSKPQVASGLVAALRTGLTASGNSVISVYQGNSEVAAAGAAVNVKQGMGVAVKPGQQPPPPKPLLKAPVLSAAVAAQYAYTNPELSWQSVNDADGYLLEICADALCQSVVKQAKVQQPKYQIHQFNQVGSFHWRVAAISVDELVGFRSNTQAIEFTSAQDDLAAPLLAIEVLGDHLIEGDQIIISPQATLQITAHDVHSGLADLTYQWNQNGWQSYAGEAVNIPDTEATLQIKAVDQLGHMTTKMYQFLSSGTNH